MKINTENGARELRETTVNNTVYLSHQDLKLLAREDGIMFDFPHLSVEANASAMCVVSNIQGMRCYGTGQAQTLKHAADLAFDNAVIDLYKICGRSAIELDIVKTAETAKKMVEKATTKKAAEEAAAKKAAEEAAAKKAAEEAAAKKAAEEAAAKKAAEEAAAKKAAEEAAAKKAAEEAAAKKAAEEAAARKKAAEEAAQRTGYWYKDEPDWVGCHSLTPEDPDDTVIDYGPFRNTSDPSELKPGPKYLSQVLKYRADFVEKMISIQPPMFVHRIPQFLGYCSRHGIGLHATSGKARDALAQYGVKEL